MPIDFDPNPHPHCNKEYYEEPAAGSSSAVTRAEHFKRLNAYTTDEGWKTGRYDFAGLVGQRWEITKELYWEFLEVLPPVNWRHDGNRESFMISEALTENIRSMYSHEGGAYFHQWVRYPERRPRPVCPKCGQRAQLQPDDRINCACYE